MLSVARATALPGFWGALEALEGDLQRILAETVRFAEVPSPTGAEERRAAVAHEVLADALGEARIDEAGNVIGCLPGDDKLPGVLICAPLDASYEAGFEPTIDVRADRMTGYGVAAHAYALAVLAAIGRRLARQRIAGLGPIWFAATVGSEMAGDLRGICHLFPWVQETCDRVLCLQGPGVGRLDHWSVGTYRGELTVLTPGGHCWRDAGRPSALRLAMEFSRRMEALPRPGFPRTLYNPAILESGDGWNNLASRAALRFELRSDGEEVLQSMILAAQQAAHELVVGLPGCRATLEQKGFRHATGLYPDHPLVVGCRESQAWAGLTSRLGASSSDASVCLHFGVAAVTLGLCEAVGLHTSQETMNTRTLIPGLHQAFAALVQLAGGAG